MTLWSCKKTAWLYKKVTFKIYDVLTWKSNITLLPYIPRRKASQATKFGQLIGYNVETYVTYIKLRSIEIYWKQASNQILSALRKLFQKTKIGLELVSLSYFLRGFWRKKIIWLYYINWPSFIVWLSLLREILGMCFVIVC